jgi:hypothetical protein
MARVKGSFLHSDETHIQTGMLRIVYSQADMASFSIANDSRLGYQLKMQ